jgi:hypothetical protein
MSSLPLGKNEIESKHLLVSTNTQKEEFNMEVWYVAEGSTRPELVDAESSRNWVYIRKDVHTETHEDEVTGESYTVYVWLEMKIPKDVYPVYEQEMQN